MAVNVLRPTSYAIWASGPSGYVTEPIQADQTQGFQPTGIARSSYVNWLWGVAGGWHQYLDRQTFMDVVVREDFARYRSALFVEGATVLAPFWRTQGSGTVSVFPYSNDNGNGFAQLISIAGVGQTASLDQDVGFVKNQDFRLSMLSKVTVRGSSGGFIEQGILGVCAFFATGQSGYYNLRYVPSGPGVPTSITLNVDPLSVTGTHRYDVERIGPTLMISVDRVLVAAAPAVAMYMPTGITAGGHIIGLRNFNPAGGSTSISQVLDAIELRVDRG